MKAPIDKEIAKKISDPNNALKLVSAIIDNEEKQINDLDKVSNVVTVTFNDNTEMELAPICSLEAIAED